jgi:ABC-type multidrug transport system fused ATPase/permease subunit
VGVTKLKQTLSNSTLGRSLRILPKSDRSRILSIALLQVGLGFMDLASIAMAGVLGGLAVSGLSAQQPGDRVQGALNFLNLDSMSLQNQALILGLGISGLMVSKTIVSIFFTRRTIFFLTRRGAVLTSILISKLMAQSLQKVYERSPQQILYSLTAGVNSVTVGVLGTAVSLVADVSLLLIIFLGLFIVDSIVALSTFAIFGAIGLTLHKLLSARAKQIGLQQSMLSISSAEKIMEVLGSYRELVVKNRRAYYSRIIGERQLELANKTAEISFMPQIGKYVIEMTVVIGSLIICGIQFLLKDAAQAISVLSVFLVASARIAPAVLRIQQGTLGIRASLGTATPTLEMIESLGDSQEVKIIDDRLETLHIGFDPSIEMSDVGITYPGKSVAAISEISMKVTAGNSIAIVGPSGAGKTTLVDSLLGILEPNSGRISISGKSPLDAISTWPGSISYLPQDILISNGSIRENVSLGYPTNIVSDDLVWDALKIAKLDDYVRALPEGLNTYVGDRGTQISGGQRQRLGIARAMLTKPKLLVLDEATSALDGKTELGISEAILELHGKVTIVMIAHRLSTIRNVDVVYYMDNGQLVAQGSFDEVRTQVPDFDHQIELMGLK